MRDGYVNDLLVASVAQRRTVALGPSEVAEVIVRAHANRSDHI